MNIRKTILLRVYLAFGLVVLGAIIVFAKLIHLQYVDGGEWRTLADSLSIQKREIEATRGNIYSNDGSLLATSVPEYEIRFDAMAVPAHQDDVFNAKVDSLAYSLSDFFKDRSSREYLVRLKEARAKGNRYLLLKRRVSHQDLKKIQSFPLFKSFRVGRDRFPGGLVAVRDNKRILPFTNLAARTIGYKNTKGVDTVRVGLEGAYGDYIEGTSGSQLKRRIAGGAWVPVSREVDVAPVDGSDIIATLDVNMQDMAQRALAKQMKATKADEGSVILMEVATGEVRAIANLSKDKDGEYREKFNIAIAQGADPGSTFKAASYLIALNDGVVDTSTIIDIGNGTYKVPAHTIRDSHAPKKSLVSVMEAFEQSSNVGVAKMINTHYHKNPAKFTSKLHEWGLAQPLGLQIPGEGEPWIKTPQSRSWSRLSLVQMAYGYEMKLTPLQTLTLYNGIANNGKMLAPLFVKEIRHLGNTKKTFKARVMAEQMASPEAIGKIQDMLASVVEKGTGRSLKSPLYTSAGKTGTAQIADASRGYGMRRYQSSFVGYFPAESPKYSIIVVIRNPKTGYYGATTAGPVFKELADMIYANDLSLHDNFAARKINVLGSTKPISLKGAEYASHKVYSLLGFTKELTQTDENEKNESEDFLEKIKIQKGVMPDVKGMGLIDAVYAMENAGYKTRVNGKGKVIAQSAEPGEKMKLGTRVLLELN